MRVAAWPSGQVCWRVNTPRWAVQPTSGAGAAKAGGRFNAKGVPALYLALDAETALREYQQDEPLMPPGTIAAYHVALDRVVDLRDGYSSEGFAPLWEDWACEWRTLRFLDGITPPSWEMGAAAMVADVPAILFPSRRHPGGVNLVVFTDLLDAARGRGVRVHDPDGRLQYAG